MYLYGRDSKHLDLTLPCELTSNKLNPDGYGSIQIAGYRLHHRYRFAQYFDIDLINSSDCVLHACDNRACILPQHLFLGSIEDNTEDMMLKNRQAKGSKHSHAKLTEADVLNIKKLFKAGATQKELCKQFNMSSGSISLIVRGITWRHV